MELLIAPLNHQRLTRCGCCSLPTCLLFPGTGTVLRVERKTTDIQYEVALDWELGVVLCYVGQGGLQKIEPGEAPGEGRPSCDIQ